MLEKNLQTRITRYVKNRWRHGSAAIEVKITKDKSLPFNAVKDHQIAGLSVAKHGTLAYKIPDTGYDQKPFDMFVFQGAGAYVMVMFWKRGSKTCYLIDIDDFLKEKETSDRKSLTEERANEIGEKITLGK